MTIPHRSKLCKPSFSVCVFYVYHHGIAFKIVGLGNRFAFMISYAATTISLIWILITGELWGLYLFAFVFGFGWGAQAVLRFSITAETFGLLSLGLIMGMLSIGEAFSAALGSYFAGLLFDILGDYRLAFWMGIVLSILGIVMAGIFKPIKNQ